MDHTHIVQATQLETYADTIASESVVPELIYLLTEQSVPNASERRVPYGEGVNQPGWDGRLVTETGFAEFIPAGRSYWEIGTNADPQAKATEEFRKRTEHLSDDERQQSSFVFVTPRTAGSGGWNEPSQEKWRNKRKNQGWKEIRIIDGVKLADWLRHFPALGCWMAKKMGLLETLGGLTTPAAHWELISESASGDPPLPAKLFTEGRDSACTALQAMFEGESQRLLLFAESPQDVFDFVAGYLEGLDDAVRGMYANRCLFVREEEAWRTVIGVRKAHVLVADKCLQLESDDGAHLQSMATQKGHAVVVPLCSAWSSLSPATIRLRSPSRSRIEQVLREAGFADVRARELASIGGDRLSALRRHFLGMGTLPSYATWESARLLAQAGLAGKWNAKNPADVVAMETLLGKVHGEWIEILRTDALRSDSPLVRRDEKWRIVARGEAWNVLGCRITDDDLDRLQRVAVEVLGERDPSFDLPKEQRFAAAIHGKHLQHSNSIRDGLAETLALLGSRPECLSSCSQGKPETIAVLTVRQLLGSAKWDRWASLNQLLPLLAEAAPDEFLTAVESALVDLANSPFHLLFAQEGEAIVGGGTCISGLLWALETLAWSPDFLSRVSVILADLSEIDPGGQHTNRPARSLLDIFLPWHFQTCAAFEQRKASVETVIREHHEVGWTLLLGLLPHNHGLTLGSRQPAWRSYVPPDWKDSVLTSEYWEQIEKYTEFALRLAQGNPERLEELIERYPDLHDKAQDALLEHLGTEPVLALPEAERSRISEKLDDLVRRHRKFANADWTMPEERLTRIEARSLALAPTAPDYKYRRLFNKQTVDLFDQNGKYEEQFKRVDDARQDAVKAILDAGGVSNVLKFATNILNPDDVGNALGKVVTNGVDQQIIPPLLDSQDSGEKRFVAGVVWGRWLTQGWSWVDRMLAMGWHETQKVAFLLILPFEQETWIRTMEHLGQAGEVDYWRNVVVNPFGPDRELSTAIAKLIEHGRADAAVYCVSATIDRTPGFDAALAMRGLLAVLETPSLIERLDRRTTVEVIQALQATPGVDLDVLFRIEWYFLPWLGRFSEGSPRTLENRLASDAVFFAEVVALVYRSRNSDPAEQEPPSERRQALAKNAYGLLQEWSTCPGRTPDGSIDAAAFADWMTKAKHLTKVSGHAEVAQVRIGGMLLHAPRDPDGLWMHPAVASALNDRDSAKMRSGYTIALFNSRGMHDFTAGKAELELARKYREKADALDTHGYTRFGATMREFAKDYEREARREAERDPFEDS